MLLDEKPFKSYVVPYDKLKHSVLLQSVSVPHENVIGHITVDINFNPDRFIGKLNYWHGTRKSDVTIVEHLGGWRVSVSSMTKHLSFGKSHFVLRPVPPLGNKIVTVYEKHDAAVFIRGWVDTKYHMTRTFHGELWHKGGYVMVTLRGVMSEGKLCFTANMPWQCYYFETDEFPMRPQSVTELASPVE